MPESIYCQRSYRQHAANNGTVWIRSKMQKAADAADIPVLIFGPFWVIFGPFWQFWVIFGQFWVIFGQFWVILGNFRSFMGHFFMLIFLGQKCISAIFITFCISVASRTTFKMSSDCGDDISPDWKVELSCYLLGLYKNRSETD